MRTQSGITTCVSHGNDQQTASFQIMSAGVQSCFQLTLGFKPCSSLSYNNSVLFLRIPITLMPECLI